MEIVDIEHNSEHYFYVLSTNLGTIMLKPIEQEEGPLSFIDHKWALLILNQDGIVPEEVRPVLPSLKKLNPQVNMLTMNTSFLCRNLVDGLRNSLEENTILQQTKSHIIFECTRILRTSLITYNKIITFTAPLGSTNDPIY